MQPTIQRDYSLAELNLEKTLGSRGTENDRKAIPVIDLSDFHERKQEITEQLWAAAIEVGFFQVTHHDIALTDINKAFQFSEQFFSLPITEKEQYPLKDGLNAGWEFQAQVRPSTGTADRKESYQITRPHMTELWPEESESPSAIAGFQSFLLSFEHQCWQLGMNILSCFADKLGFTSDFFRNAHNWQADDYQSTLRLLHYLPMEGKPAPGIWRAGAHTDFDCLTMVFQKAGQGGLQACPGKDSNSQLEWTNVVPKEGVITCNIGDMLMRWSDDQLKSTLHRVRMPQPDENQGSRYSMAFFCQANRNEVIQGPKKKYQAITAADYLQQRIKANF
ncbi:hypothetical protein CAPTEDRAFT_130805 [Capitella teleta]|uniref:Fe2OG dioxygenase domain-containing protein n=1 Tax=Capitella teleta TaxID=283909 RepID=R7V9D3_CAPTE|nr:hypothetical protein CAPTEDRAFT_130805 [Capitella teleta]|eukprot:ELU12350.1 hypothetical protein CAPTEDRAFT_130805 [Capitella teleta]